MNRSRIEWCDHTLNIVTGCRRGCEYCYARTMSLRRGRINTGKMGAATYWMNHSSGKMGNRLYILLALSQRCIDTGSIHWTS